MPDTADEISRLLNAWDTTETHLGTIEFPDYLDNEFLQASRPVTDATVGGIVFFRASANQGSHELAGAAGYVGSHGTTVLLLMKEDI